MEKLIVVEKKFRLVMGVGREQKNEYDSSY